MAQRAWIELDRLNHQVSVQIATEDKVMESAVNNFQPDLIIAPFLKKRIPDKIWKNNICLVVHPGIIGDRGASSIDWAILKGVEEWGVTILQAVDKMDAGAVWSTHNFPMRPAKKSCLYRHEVTQAAMKGLLEAVSRFEEEDFQPIRVIDSCALIKGQWNKRATQKDYQFLWSDKAEDILRKITAADSDPGVLTSILGEEYFVFGAHLEETFRGEAGSILGRRNKAICIASYDKAIWLTNLKRNREGAIKLPSTIALRDKSEKIRPLRISPFEDVRGATFQEIRFVKEEEVGYLYFDFYNGAMDTEQCYRLRDAIVEAKKQSIKILVLMGGEDVWSNGIHLNIIEDADNPAEESWNNIHAINDLILEIIKSPNQYIVTALQGNAGAGGVSLALSGDKVLAREGIILNPHTQNMGLYGSEYWTYLLPKRIGTEKANHFTEQCLPWGTLVAKEIGLIDDVFGESALDFRKKVKKVTQDIAGLPYFDKLLMAKRFQLKKDERVKPLAKYREEELKRMRKNFYDNDQGYHEKRHRFVYKIFDPKHNKAIEDRDWYSSRRKIYRRRKWEPIDY